MLAQRGTAFDQQNYKSYLRENLDTFLDDEEKSPIHRVQMLHTVGHDMLEEAFEHPDPGEAVRGATEVGGELRALLPVVAW